jgi:hypothetical protein
MTTQVTPGMGESTSHRLLSRFVGRWTGWLITLVAVLPLFAWSQPAVAQEYLTCTAEGVLLGSQLTGECAGNWIITPKAYTASVPPGSPEGLSSFIGYARTTEAAGTVPAYLTCTAEGWNSYQGLTGLCAGNWIITPKAYTATGESDLEGLSSFIGYVYPTQAASTVPAYLTCTAEGILLGSQLTGKCAGNWIITSKAYTASIPPGSPEGLSSFIGYVYPTSTVSTSTATVPYVIGSVYYAPAGAGSTITYGDQTVTGTTVGTTQSWAESVTVGVSAGIGGVSFGNNFSGSTSTTTDMSITTTVSETFPPKTLTAPATIDHDYDEILIYLGVQLHAALQVNGSVQWSLDFTHIPSEGFSEQGYFIPVGCLKSSSTLPAAAGCAEIVSFLSANGITSSAYPSLLAADPFATTTPTPDPNRYVLLSSFSFLPSDPTTNYEIVNSTTTTNTQTESYTYSETFSGGLGSLLKVSDTISFTNSSTDSNKTGSTATSNLMLVSPTASVPGQTTLFVYEDTIYKTFMFSFVDNGTP